MRRRAFYFEIFAISFAAILLEIAYTRIFSFKVYYYFTYLIIGIAMLGLGAGAVSVAVSRRLRASDPNRLIPWLCVGCAAAVLAGYFPIAWSPLSPSQLTTRPMELAKIAGVGLLLLVPFFGVGVMIPLILGARPDRVNRLYGADLLGAALACSSAVFLLIWLSPPGCVVMSALVFAAAGLRGAGRSRALWATGGASCAVLGLLLLRPGVLPDPVTDELKQIGPGRSGPLLHSEWHPVFRVDVTAHPIAPRTAHILNHDGWMGSVLHHFDGDFSKLSGLRNDARSVPFSLADPDPEVLIVGFAGGHEVLASLYFGASRIVGVELNPVTFSLVTDTFADFGGRLAEDPRVSLFNDEARSFLKRDDGRYDLIWLVAPDSYASMNAASSAAFVLSESYLYTVEMLQEGLAHLAPRGMLCAQFGERDLVNRPNRTVRFLSTARKALAERGIDDFGAHVLVLSALGLPPLFDATVLVSPEPISLERRRAFVEAAGRLPGGAPHWVDGVVRRRGPISDVVDLPSDRLERWYDAYPYNVRPVRDDSPFFWHFARFRDVLRSPQDIGFRGGDWEILIGEQVMLGLLGLTVILAAIFLLLPLAALRPVFDAMPWKAATGIYFACLGAGFMLLEVSLIQRFTLFLGYPTYSLSVTLFALLLSSGVGSIASGRLLDRRNRALAVIFAGVACLTLFHHSVAPIVFDRFVGAALPVRAAVAVALIAPLGLCLGAFLPLGLATVGGLGVHGRAYVAWAWGVNGFFSVISSIAGTILAMVGGFQLLLQIALLLYAVAVIAIWRVPLALRSDPAD